MLSYRHLFHAGNFADVFKHILLTRLIVSMNKKDKPYFYLDTPGWYRGLCGSMLRPSSQMRAHS